jgi:hypothetical protein
VSEVDAIELFSEFWARWVGSHLSWIFFIALVINIIFIIWRMLNVEVNARISMAQVTSLLDFIEF